MSVSTYQSEPVSTADAAYRTAKRFKNAVPGFVEEVLMPSEDNPDKLYAIIHNAATGERRCPCTSWVFKSRQGGTCKHITRYLGVLAAEKQFDPVTQQAGRIFDAVMAAIGVVSACPFARNRGVGMLADELRKFVPRAGQTGLSVTAADVVPGTTLRRIRF